jgi:hypothetical protein
MVIFGMISPCGCAPAVASELISGLRLVQVTMKAPVATADAGFPDGFMATSQAK